MIYHYCYISASASFISSKFGAFENPNLRTFSTERRRFTVGGIGGGGDNFLTPGVRKIITLRGRA